MHTVIETAAALSLVVILAACGGAKDASKGNFSKVIQAYLDTRDGLCVSVPLGRIPFTLAQKPELFQPSPAPADALVDAGLLTSRDTQVKQMFGDKMLPGTEYQLSAMGKKYLVDGKRFCTGRYVVVEVEGFTEPGDMMGMKVSRVRYRYKAEGAADWVQSAKLRAANDELAEQSDEEIPGAATLVLTDSGWMHEDMPQHRPRSP